MMRLLITIMIFGCFCAKGQEYWDLKYHEGSDAAKFNNDPNFQSNLHNDAGLRNKEKVETTRGPGFILTKQQLKQQERLNREKSLAFGQLEQMVFTKGGKLIDCHKCQGSGTRTCAVCNGAGSSICSSCRGDSQLACRSCSGSGIVGDQTCVKCAGTGKKVCQFCNGLPQSCARCAGIGYENCPNCRGATKMLITLDLTDTLEVVDQMPITMPVENARGHKSRKKS